MTWTVKRKYTRPNTDVDFYTAPANIYPDWADGIASGKVISFSSEVLSNGLEKITTVVFKDQAARNEWRSDSGTQARIPAAETYNTANNISKAVIQNEVT